jgi:hypothetical protein
MEMCPGEKQTVGEFYSLVQFLSCSGKLRVSLEKFRTALFKFKCLLDEKHSELSDILSRKKAKYWWSGLIILCQQIIELDHEVHILKTQDPIFDKTQFLQRKKSVLELLKKSAQR